MEKDKGRNHPQLKQESVEFLLQKFQPMMDRFNKETGVSLEYNIKKLFE
jgi:hypothetical protein